MLAFSRENLRSAAGLLLAVLLSVVGFQVVRRLNSHGPEALLRRADDLSWLNSWIQAEPLYRRAELEFIQRHHFSKELCATLRTRFAQSVSSSSIPEAQINSRVHPIARLRSSEGHNCPLIAPTLFLRKAEQTAAKDCGFATLRAA